MKEEHLYDVIETNENNARNVISAPQLWIKDNVLFWPSKGAFTKRKNPTPPEDGWTEIPCKILKKGLTSLIKALAEEKRLSQFSNTESEAEDKKQREYKRKHPVHSQNTQNPINLNEHFNKIKDEKEKETKYMKTVIFDPVVPVEMLASASTDNCYQENDFTAPSSIDGNGEKNLLNTDAVSNNNIEEEHAMSTTSGASLSTPIIISVPAASNSNGIDSTYTSLPPAMDPNYYFYPHPHMYNMSHFGNANAQNNVIPVQYHSNGQNVPNSFTYSIMGNVNNAENQSASLQQPSSTVSKSLPPFTQYPHLTNISPNWPRINVPHSTMASTSVVRASMSSTSMPSTSEAEVANTSKINIIGNERIVGPRTEGNGKIKQFQQNTKDIKLGRTIGNKHYQNLKSVFKKNDKMTKPKEHQIVKGKKQVKAFLSKGEINPQNLIENRDDSSGGQTMQYIKSIHKEILAMKTFNKNEALKRRETDKKITEGFQKLQAEILELKDSSKISVQDLILEQDQIQEFDTYFTITDQKEFETFVLKLSIDQVYKNLLKLRLARIGGTKPQLMLRAIMKYLVHDSLLLDYSWAGTSEKESFQELTILNNTILESIQMIHRLYTEKEYNKYMKNFVNQAKFRLRAENCNHEGERKGVEDEDKERKNVEDEENENDEFYEDEGDNSGVLENKEGMVEYEYLNESE